ncbi:MAG TPA: hypothetical protein VMN79_02055 [Casimicrobiaceae bacterium]|nr:hypothetical protein [Casimicrobiaceae bacterium]
MTNRMRQTRSTLRHWRNFVTGALIGAAIQTPVYAATEDLPDEWAARLQHGDWSLWLLAGSIVLLIVAVALHMHARARGTTVRTAPAHEPENAIGRYRPQVHRP